MPSPDLRAYTDLTVYDALPDELVDRALLAATTKLPGWTPREGNTEVVLMEALALEVAELVFAVNRLPGAVVEVLVRLFGVTRSDGEPPVATATFTLTDNAGYTVPAGTSVRLDLGGEVGPVEFTTDADIVVAAGATTGTGPITATTNTTEANGVAVGTDLDLIDPVAFVETVALATSPSGGADPEDVAAWLDRGVERFGRLTETLVLPEHFTSAALDDARVYRATTIDNHDGTATASGHVAVAVAGSGGALLAAGIQTDIEETLEAAALANLDVHVIDPTITTVAVTVEVVRIADATDGDVQAAIETALGDYLNPDTWPWAGTVRRNELIALIDGVAGVDYVVSLTAPAADVALTGVAPLADLGVVTVTVTPP